MRSIAVFALGVSLCSLSAQADFSYTSTRKTTGGTMAAMAGNAANGTTNT